MNIIVNNIASAIPFDVIYPETIPWLDALFDVQ
jgi:hypothetical protein